VIPLPWLILVFVLSAGGAFAAGDWHGHKTEKVSIEAQNARDDKLADKVAKAGRTAAAMEIQQLDIHHDQIIQPLQTEIRERVVYRDCINTDLGLQLINSAITGSAGQVPGDLQLPAAAAPH
jgi:hypothetical protein